MRINIISYLFLIIISACTKNNVKNEKEYLAWLNNEESGLIKTKYVNGILLKLKYLPPEYLAYRELSDMENYTDKQKDSIISGYAKSISFVFTIGTDEQKSNSDVMLKEIANYKEYKERFLSMNFGMDQYVSLIVGDKKYSPVLSNMENTYGLEQSRNIIFVFTPAEKTDNEIKSAEQLDFVYVDELFGLGTNHFVFNKSDINNIPSFPFGMDN